MTICCNQKSRLKQGLAWSRFRLVPHFLNQSWFPVHPGSPFLNSCRFPVTPGSPIFNPLWFPVPPGSPIHESRLVQMYPSDPNHKRSKCIQKTICIKVPKTEMVQTYPSDHLYNRALGYIGAIGYIWTIFGFGHLNTNLTFVSNCPCVSKCTSPQN